MVLGLPQTRAAFLCLAKMKLIGHRAGGGGEGWGGAGATGQKRGGVVEWLGPAGGRRGGGGGGGG